MRRIVFISCMFLCLALQISGRTDRHMFIYEHIGTANGLASQRVYSMAEDRFGGIWIGNKNGVARYNGRTLHNYTLDNNDKRSDTGGMIIKVAKNGDGNIIAFNNRGEIFQYSEELDRFIPIATAFTKMFEDVNKNAGGLILNNVTPDKDGSLWISTNKGIFLISAYGKTVRRYFQHLSVNCSLLEGNNIIVCTTTSAFMADKRTGKFLRTLLDKNTETAFIDKQRKRLWIGTFNSGATVIDMNSWQQISTDLQRQLPHTPVRAIENLNDTTMLLGIDGNGVYISNRNGKNVRLLWNDDDQTGNAIHGNGIYDILRDSQNNIWIGSYTGGIDIAYPTGGVMETFEHRQGVEQSLMNNGVNDILENRGYLTFATDQGISILNTETQQWTHTLKGKVALTLCPADNGILAGTYGDGVFKIKNNGEYIPIYSTANGMLATDYVFSVHKDRKGNIWIGCLDGPTVQIAGNRTYRYDIATVQSITDAPNGNIAIGTASGFYIIDPVSHATTHYLDFEECKNRNINNYIRAILFNTDGTVWLATDGGGIYHYNLKTRKHRAVTRENGLPSNNISAISFDEKGRVIASTDAGLAIVYPKTMDAININFLQGLNREYNRTSMSANGRGRILFGSNSGAVSINPLLIDKLEYKTTLRFSQITINGDNSIDDGKLSYLHKALEKGNVELDYSDNTFTVAFESISYRYRNDILFQYILEGFDNTWSEPKNITETHFTNLPSGNYTLKVRAVSRNNMRVLDEKSVTVNVKQPWWNSVWAWIIYCAILATIAYLAMKNYRGKLERRYFNEKIDFFIHAAHDIRTPLSLVLAPLSDISKDNTLSEKSRKCLDIAITNGNKLFGIISDLLDFQKADIANSPMRMIETNVNFMLQGVRDKFYVMAQDKHISIGITECPDNITVSTDYELMTKLFDNLLSNAIKYTPDGGSIQLRGYTDSGKVRIEVKDNGIGIPKKDQKNIFKKFFRAENAAKTHITGSGLGLMLAQRIACLHNGTLTFESEEGKGTTFTVTLPVLKRDKAEIPTHTQDFDEADKSDIILFVDDNADLRSYIAMAFSNTFKVVTVENGEKALDYLKENECDIVVSDVMMPGMQGDELCSKIKENNDTSWMPVILLSAKASKDFIIGGLETGADDYMAKPFNPEILKSKIVTTLANRRRMSEYYRRRVRLLAGEAQSAKDDETLPNEENTPNNTSDADQNFINKATGIVMNNMSDTDFDIESLCREMAMSRTLFYGKIKTLLAQTPQEFVRNIRLQHAASLLREGKHIIDVCTICGFVNSKHFSTIFKKKFGVSPSKFE